MWLDITDASLCQDCVCGWLSLMLHCVRTVCVCWLSLMLHCVRTVCVCRRHCRYMLQYQENIPCEQLVMRLCDLKQAYTQFGGTSV